jgi:hypothetical protein
MNYIAEMSLGALIYVPNSVKIDSAIQKLIGGGGIHVQTDTQQRDLISLILFYQNKESRIKSENKRGPN